MIQAFDVTFIENAEQKHTDSSLFLLVLVPAEMADNQDMSPLEKKVTEQIEVRS